MQKWNLQKRQNIIATFCLCVNKRIVSNTTTKINVLLGYFWFLDSIIYHKQTVVLRY